MVSTLENRVRIAFRMALHGCKDELAPCKLVIEQMLRDGVPGCVIVKVAEDHSLGNFARGIIGRTLGGGAQ